MEEAAEEADAAARFMSLKTPSIEGVLDILFGV